MELHLKVLSGCHADRIITIRKSSFLVGRAVNCDLRMKSHKVSRRHCRILLEDSHVVIEDLMSSNGTFLNGRRIEGRHPLGVRDRLLIRPLEFEVIAIELRNIKPADVETARVAVSVACEDEFESSVFEWMSAGEGAITVHGPSEEEYKRVNPNDTVALGESETINIISKEIKEQVAAAAAQARPPGLPEKRAPKRFIAPRPHYTDSGNAAAETLRAFFHRT